MKKPHNISLDPDISQIVEEKQKEGKLILSRFVNNALREIFKEDLKKHERIRDD